MLWLDMLHKSCAKMLKRLLLLSVLFERGDQIGLTLGHKEMRLLVAVEVDSQGLLEVLDGRRIVLQLALVVEPDVRDDTRDLRVRSTVAAEGVPAYRQRLLVMLESLIPGVCSTSKTQRSVLQC